MLALNIAVQRLNRSRAIAGRSLPIFGCILAFACISDAATTNPIIAAYYGSTPGTTTLASLVSAGGVTHLTHLIYAFAPQNSANPCTGAPALSASDAASLKEIRSANPNMKFLISVGGAGSGPEFEAVAANASFAANCVGYLMAPNQGIQFDGIDIDWETPGSATDEQNFNLLLSSFRAALTSYAQANNISEHLLLTAAITPEHTSNGWLYIDFAGTVYPPGATSSVDFFNVEFYEYAYVGDGVTESNAPLYEINADLYGNANVYGADEGIITNGGVPPAKIVVGIPFYGVHYTGVSNGAVLGQPGTLETNSQGNVPYYYYQLMNKPGALYNDGNGSTGCSDNPLPVTCDGIGASAWIWNSSTKDLWDFDDPETIAQKAQYAQSKQLGGIFGWNLMEDTPGGALVSSMVNAYESGPAVLPVAPSSGSGTTQTFQMVYTDSAGISNISTASLLLNAGLSAANGCYIAYVPASNAMYLLNNQGTAVLSPAVTPGSSGSVANSQCTLSGAGSSVEISGNVLVLNVALTFSQNFEGSKNVYLDAATKATSSGWMLEGTWTPAAAGAPTVVSLSPDAGSGSSETFTMVYDDPAGIEDLSTASFVFNSSLSAKSGCYVAYVPASNAMYLLNDAGTAVLSPAVTPGSSTTVSNSQCTVSGSGSSSSISGTDLTLKVQLTFSSTFTGQKNVYLNAQGKTATSGWVEKGTWTP